MKNQEAPLDAQNEVGLEVNAEKNKYFLISYHQTAGQIHNMKVAKKSLKNVSSSNIWEQR
jgi:hypothetical protein